MQAYVLTTLESGDGLELAGEIYLHVVIRGGGEEGEMIIRIHRSDLLFCDSPKCLTYTVSHVAS